MTSRTSVPDGQPREKQDDDQCTRNSSAGQANEKLARLASFPLLNPNPVIEVDLNGTVTFMNTAAHTLFPDLRDKGFLHDYLCDVKKFAAEHSGDRAASSVGAVRVGDNWYQQATYLVPDNSCIRIYGIDITERKLGEEALLMSEEKFRCITEASADVIFQMDTEGSIIYCSPAILAFGYSPDQVLGESFSKFVLGDELSRAVTALQRVKAGESISLFEITVLKADGSTAICEVSASPMVKGGTIVGIQGIARDITGRKRAEEKLEQARAENLNEKNRLEAVMEALPVGVALLDDRGGNIRSNSTFEKIWGVPRPLVRGISDYAAYKAWWVETGKQVQPEEWASSRAVTNGETVVGQLMQIVRFDGTRAFVLNSATPILGSDGKVTGCAVAILDMTSRIETEEALKASETKYRSLFTNMTDGFGLHKIILDETGKPVDYVFLEVNRAFELLTGLKAADIVGKRVTAVLPGIEHDPADWIGTYGSVALTRKELRFEQYAEPLGRWYSISAYSPMQGFFVTLFEDITARKDAEEVLRKAKEELEVSVRKRTADLLTANQELEEEIAVRREIQQHITATNELLKLFSQTFLRKEYLDELIGLLRKWCECDGVGIRLIDEQGNIPYGSFSGFSREFWEQENCLSVKKDHCVCPRIISQRPSLQEVQHMTPNGSFFCNDMTCFISAMTEKQRARYRGTCAEHGFASLATVPIRYRNRVLGAIHFVDKNKGKVPRKLVEFIESLSPLMGEALYRFYLEEALMSSREQLRNLSMHLQDAREEERTKVAREIHDELGQTLTAAIMELSRIKAVKELQESVSDIVRSASELIDRAVQDIQRICSDLRPRVLDHLGLWAAIEWQAKKFSERSGIRCSLDLTAPQRSLPEATSTALFRIFQETLTNVARHAKATEVTVHMGIVHDILMLEIKDNGKGIGRKKIFGKDSFGIMGIRERVHDLGGNVTFKSVRNKGTTVTVEVPITKGGV